MASSPSSRLKFYNESGTEIAGPREGQECGIVINVPKNLQSKISLKLNAVLLPVSVEEVSTVAYSIWPPSDPGMHTLSLSCGSIRENLTVMVTPENFIQSDYNSMINELTDVLPNLIAANLNKCGAQLSVDQTNEQSSSLDEEWLRIKRAVNGTKDKPGLLQLLPVLQRECNQILSPKLEIRTGDKIRRPEMSRLPQAISMPGNMISEEKLYRMFDTTVTQSLETYENRLTKTYVQAIRSQLSRLQARVGKEQAPPAMATELEALANEFNLACIRASFLREVRSPSISADRVTMVLLKNPAYRAVLEGYLALNQHSKISLEEQALNAPLDHFPFLYRLWINLRVLSALIEVCAESGFQCVSHYWIKSYRKGAFIQVTTDGNAAVHLAHPTTGTQVSLIPWRNSGNSASSPTAESMTIAVAIETPAKPLSVLLFFPKYKVAKGGGTAAPIKEDVDEVLRSIEMLKKPGEEQQFQFAALLYPGPSIGLDASIEAVSAQPAHGNHLQKAVADILRHFLPK